MTVMEVEVGILKSQMSNLEGAVKEIGNDVKHLIRQVDSIEATKNDTEKRFETIEDRLNNFNDRLSNKSWVQNTLSAIIGIVFTGLVAGFGYWIFHK